MVPRRYCRIEGLVSFKRHRTIGVHKGNVGVSIKFVRQYFKGIGSMPIISIRICQVKTSRNLDTAIPSLVHAFSCSSQIANVVVTRLKLFNNAFFVLSRSTVNDYDFNAVGNGLLLQAF